MPVTKVTRSTALPALTSGLAATPLAWLLLFALFILRARLVLGRWPTPLGPDPKDLGFDLHHAAIVAGVPLVFAAVLFVIAQTLLTQGRAGRQWSTLVVAVAGLAAVLALGRIDPGHMFMWFGD